MSEAWAAFLKRGQDLDALGGALGLLEWDQQTYMPKGSGASRGIQAGVIGRIHHELGTGADLGGWLTTLATEQEQGVFAEGLSEEVQRAAVRNARRRYERNARIPGRLVEEFAAARSDAFMGWMKGRTENDFAPFEKPLQRLIDLSREQAELLGYSEHPYNALLEEYDPGSTVASLQPMFRRLGAGLNEFLSALEAWEDKSGPAEFKAALSGESQRTLSQRIIRDMGFSVENGRLDLSEHPFTVGMDIRDVRLTMHLHGEDLLSTLGGVIHECGHGLYEQGLPTEWAATGVNRAAGMGIHESQSRLWENFIGRSKAFARYLTPRMQTLWPELELNADTLYGAMNRVQRSLIRVQADEVTYNLHIIARFELEVAILEGKLNAADLPAAWDAAYRKWVGVVASGPKEGVLQDIHWSSGLFGYFPSYTIGNLYAASIGATLEGLYPNLWEEVADGKFGSVLSWLRKNVHQRGHIKDAPVIFAEAVGDRDPVADLLAHVWRRHGALYGVSSPGQR